MKKIILTALVSVLLSFTTCVLFLSNRSSTVNGGLSYMVIGHEDIYVRDEADRRYSIWTDDNELAQELAASFGIKDLVPFRLSPGQVFVAYINDVHHEKLVQISCYSSPNMIFADYTDSGDRYSIIPPKSGRKYSSVTLVVFTPPFPVGHFGIRCAVLGGLSERKNHGAEPAATDNAVLRSP